MKLLESILKEMGKIFLAAIILIFVLFLTSCKTKTLYVPVKQTTVETVTIRDTLVDVRIEHVRDSIITPDSTSYLSNPYGYSYAGLKDGKLHHSLATWPGLTIPVQVQYVDRLRVDSIPAPYPVEVEKFVEKKLNLWQKIRMRAGEMGMILAVIIGLVMLFKRKVL